MVLWVIISPTRKNKITRVQFVDINMLLLLLMLLIAMGHRDEHRNGNLVEINHNNPQINVMASTGGQ